MSGPVDDHENGLEAGDDAARRAQLRRAADRRRRLGEVFGESTDQTRDDADLDADGGTRAEHGRGSQPGRGDTWLREQVPPHHGG